MSKDRSEAAVEAIVTWAAKPEAKTHEVLKLLAESRWAELSAVLEQIPALKRFASAFQKTEQPAKKRVDVPPSVSRFVAPEASELTVEQVNGGADARRLHGFLRKEVFGDFFASDVKAALPRKRFEQSHVIAVQYQARFTLAEARRFFEAAFEAPPVFRQMERTAAFILRTDSVLLKVFVDDDGTAFVTVVWVG